MENGDGATVKESPRKGGRGRGGRPLLAKEEDPGMRSDWEGSAVTCKQCHYANRLSQAFFVLSVQHLYCRRCGKMIDREGKPVLSS